jgi:hypothetical protein
MFRGSSSEGRSWSDIGVLGFQIEVTSPRDVATGLASGKRQYKPVQVVKSLDKSSPKLFQALTTNEVLTSVSFLFSNHKIQHKNGAFRSIKRFHGPSGELCEEVVLDFEDSNSNSFGWLQHATLVGMRVRSLFLQIVLRVNL